MVGTAPDITGGVAKDAVTFATTALEIGAGVVEAVPDEIDEQTDESRRFQEKSLTKKD